MSPGSRTQLPPTQEEIDRIPLGLVKQLLDATTTANYDKLMLLLETASKQELSIGEKLRSLVENFDYDALKKMLWESCRLRSE